MTVLDAPAEARFVQSESSEPSTINDRIATALGDRHGSYERLIGLRICAALEIDPDFQGRLTPVGD